MKAIPSAEARIRKMFLTPFPGPPKIAEGLLDVLADKVTSAINYVADL
jgi:hypothetical protein